MSKIDIYPGWTGDLNDLNKIPDAAVSVLSLFTTCNINLLMIQILTLTQPIEFSQKMRPVCLPSDPSMNYDNKVVKATGWGYTKPGQFPDNLMKVDVKVIPIQTCRWSSVRRYLCVVLSICSLIIYIFKLSSHLHYWSGSFELWNQGRRLRQSSQLS